ncbi:hypothetical protein KCP74_00690 [Salmonella enterica subsp. enterica]|nr:hypothetical protein KCP74_00690 [Salmonella enterica subsp. enterica]
MCWAARPIKDKEQWTFILFIVLKYLGILFANWLGEWPVKRYAWSFGLSFDLFYILTNNLVCLMDKDKVIDKLMLTF